MTCPAVLVLEYPGLFTKGRVELRCGKGENHCGRHTCAPPSSLPIDYPQEAKPLITWV